MTALRKTVASAYNATLFNTDGSTHTDLFGANGTLLLGHCNPVVVQALAEQNQKVWITGRINSDTRLLAFHTVEQMIPKTHFVSGFYTTGMEAAEFALRASRILTGRKDFIGFAKSMHGKSMATAFLAWDNPSGYAIPGIIRLPFPIADQASSVLAQLDSVLSLRATAAVFLEVFQGSGGGEKADFDFCHSLTTLCKKSGTLLVVDEILTGFYRTGSLFFYSHFPLEPDIILAGKCIGNGFPVSAVLMRRGLEINSQMLPYSTYAENSLASAAVVGTLSEIVRLPIADMVNAINALIATHLSTVEFSSYKVNGQGALWIVDTGNVEIAQKIANDAYENGVLISQAGSIIRLLPPITIELDLLEKAMTCICATVRKNL